MKFKKGKHSQNFVSTQAKIFFVLDLNICAHFQVI